MSTDRQEVDYRTHILIGVRANGIMTVISDWPHVPQQSEVQSMIDCTREPYVTFVLCTPTSIMPSDRSKALKRAPIGFGLMGPVRRR
jgi:hypothetical protein